MAKKMAKKKMAKKKMAKKKTNRNKTVYQNIRPMSPPDLSMIDYNQPKSS